MLHSVRRIVAKQAATANKQFLCKSSTTCAAFSTLKSSTTTTSSFTSKLVVSTPKMMTAAATPFYNNVRSFHSSCTHRSLLDEGDEAIVFTCGQCGTQQGHAFSTEAHDHGVVMVHCPNCGAGTIVSDNLAWYEFDENTIDYNNKIREHSLKDVTTKFEVTPQELKDLGLYDKVMERKAKYDAEHPNGDEDEDD